MSGSEIINIQSHPVAANVTSVDKADRVPADTQVQRRDVASGGKESPQESVVDVSTEQLMQAVSNISAYVQNISRDLQFQVDDTTGNTIVSVFDSETEELIRQIPSEEVVAMARYIAEFAPDPLKGLLVDNKG